MEGIENICFQIISNVGTARSLFIESIRASKEEDYEKAQKLIDEGEKYFMLGYKEHMKLITSEANNTLEKVTLLMMHSEDQLMSAEGFKILAQELMEMCKKFNV